MSQKPKAPKDRLPKIARRISVPVVLDDLAADLYQDAIDALNAREQELEGSRSRRIAQVIQSLPVDASREDREAAVKAITEAEKEVLEQARAMVAVAKSELDEVTQVFVFRALPRPEWAALKKKYPATDKDKEDWEANGGQGTPEYSLSKIRGPIIRAACVEPQLSDEGWKEMLEGGEWNEPELDNLRNHAILVQNTYRTNPTPRK